MPAQANVKQILYKLIFIGFISFILVSCKGGGDNYSSTVSHTYTWGGTTRTMVYGFKLSPDRRKVQGIIGDTYSNAIDLKVGGYDERFQIQDKKVRVRYSSSDPWGQWVDLCGTGSSIGWSHSLGIKIDIENGKARFCWIDVDKYSSWICGNWVSFDKGYVCGPSISCPSGYTYNSNTGKCEADPVCQNGMYDPQLKKCYVGDFTCPIGSYDCVKFPDGKRYCSDVPCADVSSSDSFVNTDTPQGANDKKPDGKIDANGNCLGTIYIFNGQDRRCRKPGAQTAFSDCCKKDKMSLLGLVEIGSCNSDEVVLAGLRNSEDGLSQCHYVGEYCAEKWFDTCVQKKKTYCCFGSVLARIIQEQGRQQLGIGWGEPKNPNCRGFTPKEFQNIDFGKIDFSEYENSVKKKAYQSIDVDSINSKFQQHINDIFNNTGN